MAIVHRRNVLLVRCINRNEIEVGHFVPAAADYLHLLRLHPNSCDIRERLELRTPPAAVGPNAGVDRLG